MSEKRTSRQQVAIYLLLVFTFSSVFYFLVLRGHSLGAGATDVVGAALSAVASVGVLADDVVASPVFLALELRLRCQPTLEAEGSAVQVGLASDQNNRTCHRPYPAVD